MEIFQVGKRLEILVERPNQKLAEYAFCKKGELSDLATERYHEIIKNLG